jgi:stearoyl-CoA desaturase (delta-9 desaturase)
MALFLGVACAALIAQGSAARAEYLWYLPEITLVLVPRFPLIAGAYAYALAVSLSVQRASFSPAHLVLVPLSFYLAILATSYIHNAAHNNIRPRWLRRAIGELCGLFHLVGFPDWTIVHFIHHRHADDPEWDPHPPQGLSYWRFMNGVKDSIFRVLRKSYFSHHGEDNARAQRYWKTLPVYAMAGQILKVHFWYFLFGPQAFTFLFMTSIVAKNLHYAMFNYVTHVPSPEDPSRMTIVNLNDSAFFRVINAVSHGLYFHKNHHDDPNLFDPRRAGATH